MFEIELFVDRANGSARANTPNRNCCGSAR
jgi:hypothetical protein